MSALSWANSAKQISGVGSGRASAPLRVCGDGYAMTASFSWDGTGTAYASGIVGQIQIVGRGLPFLPSRFWRLRRQINDDPDDRYKK